GVHLAQDRPEQGRMPAQFAGDLVDVRILVEHRDQTDHVVRGRTDPPGVQELWLREEEALEEVESRRLGLAELLVRLDLLREQRPDPGLELPGEVHPLRRLGYEVDLD